jgi:rod shape-determining protein MreC
MRNIFLFIRIYSNLIFFILLMSVALYMLFTYNRYHHTAYSKVAAEVTGRISTKYNNVEYYFHLKKTNDSLVKANEQLYNRLRENYEIPDTVNRLAIDSIRFDSIKTARKYIYMQAKVTRNSISQLNNYIIVHRGVLQGIHPDMGVIGINNSVVGTVMEVSDNYAVIMSLLHQQSSISARLKKGGETGTIIWDGKAPDVLILKDINKTAKISQGDTIITSGFSEKFPQGLLLGYVKDIIVDKSSSTYTVRIIPGANFNNLQYVYIIDNLQQQEPSQLLKKVTTR